MLAMGPRDLNSAPYSSVHCSSHSMTSFQSSELTELPVVENSQLFAQRAHSARYAPYICYKKISPVTGTCISAACLYICLWVACHKLLCSGKKQASSKGRVDLFCKKNSP